jgi:hypothetical protein
VALNSKVARFETPDRLPEDTLRSGGTPWLNVAFNLLAQGIRRDSEVVVALQIHPEFAGTGKVAAEAKGGVGGDASRLVYDRADAGGRNAEGESEAVDADSGGAPELFEEDFAETDGGRNG